MVVLSAQDTEYMRTSIQDAVVKCSERCLYQSAKWAAELLTSLPSPADLTPSSDRTEEDSHMFEPEPGQQRAGGTVPIVLSPNPDPAEARLEAQEVHKYLLAKSYFDCREYDRCAAVFLPDNLPLGPVSAKSQTTVNLTSPRPKTGMAKSSVPTSVPKAAMPSSSQRLSGLSQKALFLSFYAKYMAGEKRKDEESEMILGPADGGITINKEVAGISRGLETWFANRMTDDGDIPGSQGWLEYLFGIVHSKEKNDEEARRWLIRSLNVYPYNWGAWQELNGLIGSTDELHAALPLLSNNIMAFIFHVFCNQELSQSTEPVHHALNELQSIFPTSQFLKTQRALLHYHSKDYDEAESIFSSLIHEDPYRIDSLDHYSNILYVMGLRPKLAFLAQLATTTDKFRPETCCVVGNYYSLKSEHEKAVMYFRRALTLDRCFLSAWTLMGHEYVEMKNTHAAIESYRRAVDINRKDHRAWNGLGQTYEMLEMHYYALFYYQRAAALRPYDQRMWTAVGSCFNKMDRPMEAIKAHKRALLASTYYDPSGSFGSHSDATGGVGGGSGGGIMDPEALYQIALMYEKLGDHEEAASYMELTLAQEEGPDGGADDDAGPVHGVGVTLTTSKARMWLAKWEFGRGGLKRALELAMELCQDGVEVEEAKALVRDLRTRMEAGQTG